MYVVQYKNSIIIGIRQTIFYRYSITRSYKMYVCMYVCMYHVDMS